MAIGLGGSIALAAAAGARRTLSAYPRLRTDVSAEDVLFGPAAPNGKFNDLRNPLLLALERLPEVERSGWFAQIAAFVGRTIADELSVAGDATLPIRSVLIAIPVTLAAAVVVSVVPARLARRTRPASVLRSLWLASAVPRTATSGS